MLDGPHPWWMRPIVLLPPLKVQARRPGFLGSDCGCELRFALRCYLERNPALAGMMRDLDLAEVEGHAGDALRDAVRRGQAAEVGGGFEGAGLDHRESRSSRSDGMVTIAGAMIIARKTRARTRSGSMSGCLLCGL